MEMFGPIDHVALLLVAAFLAGALNAVAGGGSFFDPARPGVYRRTGGHGQCHRHRGLAARLCGQHLGVS